MAALETARNQHPGQLSAQAFLDLLSTPPGDFEDSKMTIAKRIAIGEQLARGPVVRGPPQVDGHGVPYHARTYTDHEFSACQKSKLSFVGARDRTCTPAISSAGATKGRCLSSTWSPCTAWWPNSTA
jgi:hypothetical protein